MSITAATPPVETAVGALCDSSALLAAPAALVRELETAGYLFLPGLVPGCAIDALVGDWTALLRDAGWARLDGTRLVADTAAAPKAATIAGSREVQEATFALESLHLVAHRPELLEVMATLLGTESVLRHPRPVARAVFPASDGDVLPTPPHQDHLGMQGALDTYTAWVAVANCALVDGPIAVSAGSHRAGVRRYRPLPGSRVFSCDDAGLEASWRAAELAPGDVVIFHSLTVHRALPNRGRALRLSVDCRYQRAADPISSVSLSLGGGRSWDDVYRGWERAELVRYWEGLPLDVVAFDPGYHLAFG